MEEGDKAEKEGRREAIKESEKRNRGNFTPKKKKRKRTKKKSERRAKRR